MIKYSLAMGIRMVCIVCLLFVHGWWLVIVAIGAIALPYLAVVLANVGSRPAGVVERPGGVVVVPPRASSHEHAADDSSHGTAA